MNGESKLTVEGKSKPSVFDVLTLNNIGIDLDTNLKVSLRSTVEARSISPMDQRTILSGVETIKAHFFSGKASIGVTNPKEDIMNFTLSTTPTEKKEVRISLFLIRALTS